mmetsp:Transcript_39788/g.118451  ORF Transcript_39788/g.118451 Transcript_39788/m.118451 type:complete len:240 (-) Transcript_39788:677-1396(-)
MATWHRTLAAPMKLAAMAPATPGTAKAVMAAATLLRRASQARQSWRRRCCSCRWSVGFHTCGSRRSRSLLSTMTWCLRPRRGARCRGTWWRRSRRTWRAAASACLRSCARWLRGTARCLGRRRAATAGARGTCGRGASTRATTTRLAARSPIGPHLTGHRAPFTGHRAQSHGPLRPISQAIGPYLAGHRPHLTGHLTGNRGEGAAFGGWGSSVYRRPVQGLYKACSPRRRLLKNSFEVA